MPTTNGRSRPHDPAIPAGYCQCGCGRVTNLAPHSDAKKGWVKGEHLRFVRGHGATGRPRTRYQKPCECGCGELTWGRFAPGHSSRCPEFHYLHDFIRTEGRTAEEFLEYVRGRTVEEDRGYETPCHIWTGPFNSTHGYATASFQGRYSTVHRHAYVAYHKLPSLPRNVHVDHKCRQIDCQNPEHLEAVSVAENCRRGRATRLTREEAFIVKYSTDAPREVAARFGISHGHVLNIRSGLRWAEL